MEAVLITFGILLLGSGALSIVFGNAANAVNCIGFGILFFALCDLLIRLRKIFEVLNRSTAETRTNPTILEDDLDSRERRLRRRSAVEESRSQNRRL